MIYIFKSKGIKSVESQTIYSGNINYVNNDCSIPSCITDSKDIDFHIYEHIVEAYDDNLELKEYILGYTIGGLITNVKCTTSSELYNSDLGDKNRQYSIIEDKTKFLNYEINDLNKSLDSAITNSTNAFNSISIGSLNYNLFDTNRYIKVTGGTYKNDITEDITFLNLVKSANCWFNISPKVMSDVYTPLIPSCYKILYKDPNGKFIICLMLKLNWDDINSFNLSSNDILWNKGIQEPGIYKFDLNINSNSKEQLGFIKLKKLTNKEYINLAFDIILDNTYYIRQCNISSTNNIIAIFIFNTIYVYISNNYSEPQKFDIPLPAYNIIFNVSKFIYGNYVYVHMINIYNHQVKIIAYDIFTNVFLHDNPHNRCYYDYDMNIIFNLEKDKVLKIPFVSEVNRESLYDSRINRFGIIDVNNNVYSIEIYNRVLRLNINNQTIYTKNLDYMDSIDYSIGSYDTDNNCINILGFYNIQSRKSYSDYFYFTRNIYMVYIKYDLKIGKISCSKDKLIYEINNFKLYLSPQHDVYKITTSTNWDSKYNYNKIYLLGFIQQRFIRETIFDINNIYSSVMIPDTIENTLGTNQITILYIDKKPFYISGEDIKFSYKVYRLYPKNNDIYKITVQLDLIKKVSYIYSLDDESVKLEKNSNLLNEENVSITVKDNIHTFSMKNIYTSGVINVSVSGEIK